MNFTYKTDRMILRILPANHASDVLAFYENNIEELKQLEPITDENMTKQYFSEVLEYELKLTRDKEMLRFWASPIEEPERIIGTVSFRNFAFGCYRSCEVGYKMDREYRNRGLAREMVAFGMALVLEEYHFHRIEATVLPGNVASIRLLQSLGFEREGYMRQKIRLNGVWKDHFFYAYVAD